MEAAARRKPNDNEGHYSCRCYCDICVWPVVFCRGESVKYEARGKVMEGEMAGNSHRHRQQSSMGTIGNGKRKATKSWKDGIGSSVWLVLASWSHRLSKVDEACFCFCRLHSQSATSFFLLLLLSLFLHLCTGELDLVHVARVRVIGLGRITSCTISPVWRKMKASIDSHRHPMLPF